MSTSIKVVKTHIGSFEFDTMPEAEAFVNGFNHALDTFGIWKDGVQRIGCLEQPIREQKLSLDSIAMRGTQ